MIVVAACFRTETIWIPHLSGADIVRTPMGEAAYDVLEEALDARESPTMILSTGFCGGIDPSLRTGEIVLAEQILYQEEEITVIPPTNDFDLFYSSVFLVLAAGPHGPATFSCPGSKLRT